MEVRVEVLWRGRVLQFWEISAFFFMAISTMLSTVGFKESGLGFGFTRLSGERAWVIVWYGNAPVALGTLHFQVPVSAVAVLTAVLL